jgi:hypothetical protein
MVKYLFRLLPLSIFPRHISSVESAQLVSRGCGHLAEEIRNAVMFVNKSRPTCLGQGDSRLDFAMGFSGFDRVFLGRDLLAVFLKCVVFLECVVRAISDSSCSACFTGVRILDMDAIELAMIYATVRVVVGDQIGSHSICAEYSDSARGR